MKGLTDKQRNMLEFIEEFMDSSSMAPTVYEIADNFKIKTSTVFAHLRALQRKNYLTRSSKARSISLNKPRRRSKRLSTSSPLPIPIIGGVGAGQNAHPNAESDGARRCELFCDPAIIGGMEADRNGLFALRIKGHDLKDIGILDGDIVVVKPSSSIKSGDIVVSAVGGETVIQSFKQGMETQTAPQDTAGNALGGIRGVIVALQRKF